MKLLILLHPSLCHFMLVFFTCHHEIILTSFIVLYCLFQMLKQPENLIGTDFKHQRLAALDQQLISEYEQLVTDWIGTIEQILTDSSDERLTNC